MKNIILVFFGSVVLFCSCKKTAVNDELSPATHNNLWVGDLSSLTSSGPKKFLFDAKHAQTAGNADWVIDEDNLIPQRTPTPAQSTITSATPENYWTGSLSSWGISLVKLGTNVETLPSTGSITYGNTTNVQDLLNYDVLVIDEPNTRFTTAEKQAMLSFVKNGGGLFMISDHTVSDRNNDGWDSPAIWNDFMTNNGVQSNPFGFKIDLTNISQTSSNVTGISNPITRGTQGTVTGCKFSNGATITLTAGSAAKGLIWQSGVQQTSLTNVMVAYSTYGTGRVVVVADSSPAEDNTGNPNDTLYPGWTDLSGNHSRLHLNASLWLAKLQ